MKNIVFDLGGVLFQRDKRKSTAEFTAFFDFIRQEPMPAFWTEYDRGTQGYDAVVGELCRHNHCSEALARAYLQEAIDRQEALQPTSALIRDLKAAGYHLYVLSNMSREFIDFLRQVPIYALFEGEVVSCDVGTVKPEPRIYEILLERYALDPAETLFIDDRAANLATARHFGIAGYLFDAKAPHTSCEELRRELL